MALAPGTRLGPYEIVAPLGAGGMGEVYRARDSKLKREVALKVLPGDVANDRDRLARFQREAEVLASLNHPNIAHIYGLEENALVMELVEGDDLAQRIARGPIPIEEALPIARQIAEALEAAHEAGIIHRDLKPANVKVRADGTVKVLDFGLAKALAGSSGSSDSSDSSDSSGSHTLANSPTIASPAMTQAGFILGTAAYMAPEQAKGYVVDRRADIWAFGVLLFEMLTGRALFGGESTMDVLGAVMRQPIDLTAVPGSTPPAVRRLLARCLQRDPNRRLHHIADARIEIADQIDRPDSDSSGPQPKGPSRIIALAGWAVALALGVLMLWAPQRQTEPTSRAPYRFTIPRPPGSSTAPAISPDGRRLAYAASGKVLVRALDEASPRTLVGTEGASDVFWSPDSRTIAFFAADALKRISIAGGPPEQLTTVPRGWPAGSWSSNGAILVEVTENPEAEGWYLLGPGESSLKKIRAFPANRPINPDKAFPSFLPDGDLFLFTHPFGDAATLQVGSIRSSETRPLVQADSRVFFAAPGYLVFMRDGSLLAQPFDVGTQRVTGEPVAVAEEVDFFLPTGEAGFSVSQEGTLVVRHREGRSELRWFDREGRAGDRVLDRDYYFDAAISPDGQRVAAMIVDWRRSTSDLWIADLARNVSTRLTSLARSEMNPRWSPDGKRLAFSADLDGPPNLYLMDASGDASTVLVPFDRQQQYAGGWTPDAKQVVFTKRNQNYNHTDIWTVDVEGGERRPLIATDFNEGNPAVSPNGRWLAYTSNASGRQEVYLRSFPGAEWQLRLSTDGGDAPAWRKDAKEIYYYQSAGAIMSVTVAAGADGRPSPSLPVRLFPVDARVYRSFVAAPDGQRFLLTLADVDGLSPPDEVIVDWTRLIKK